MIKARFAEVEVVKAGNRAVLSYIRVQFCIARQKWPFAWFYIQCFSQVTLILSRLGDILSVCHACNKTSEHELFTRYKTVQIPLLSYCTL